MTQTKLLYGLFPDSVAALTRPICGLTIRACRGWRQAACLVPWELTQQTPNGRSVSPTLTGFPFDVFKRRLAVTTKELRSTQKAVATSLRRLASKLSTSSLEDPVDLRNAMRSDAGLLRDFGAAFEVIANA